MTEEVLIRKKTPNRYVRQKMYRQAFLIILVFCSFFVFSGCLLTKSKEFHRIYPIQHSYKEVTVNRSSTHYQNNVRNYYKNESLTSENKEGVWLVREVYSKKGSRKVIRAIEILFCPYDEDDYSKCRIGLLWSSNKNPLGKYKVK